MKPKPMSWIPGTRIAKPASRLAMDDGRITVPTNKLGIYTCGHLFCLSCTWGFLQKSEWLFALLTVFIALRTGCRRLVLLVFILAYFHPYSPLGSFDDPVYRHAM